MTLTGEISYAKVTRKLIEEKEDIIKLKTKAEEEKKKAEEEDYLKGFSAALHMFIDDQSRST